MLRLRRDVEIAPLTLAHAERTFRWVCDPTVKRNLGLTREPSLERTRAWIGRTSRSGTDHPFAVSLAGEHVGNVVLDMRDDHVGTARFSCYIGEPSARGSGVGGTAAYLALKEGFETLELHKIWLIVHPRNIPAIRLYYRLGFLLEGILRDQFLLAGERVDALYMGILAGDFKDLPISAAEDVATKDAP